MPAGNHDMIFIGLLIWRIWDVDKQSKDFRIEISRQSHSYQSRLQRIMRILIESGLLYTTTALISFVTFTVGSNAVYVITDAVSVHISVQTLFFFTNFVALLVQEIQIVGIAFNLIIIRASQIFGHPDSTTLGGCHADSRTLSFRATRNPSGTATDSQMLETHTTKTQYSLSRLDGESAVGEDEACPDK